MTESADQISILFLTAILCVPLVFLIQCVRNRNAYNLFELILYGLCYCITRLLWRARIAEEYPLQIGPNEGAIIVANHRSSIDPFFVQLAAGRRVHWMVASEYCRHFLFGPILRTLQVIPTNRGGVDTASTKLAIRYAKQGKLVGMFPEGRINRTGKPLISIRPGAAMVAIRAGVPLVPCWIEGSPSAPSVWQPLLRPAHVTIRFGQPHSARVENENANANANANANENDKVRSQRAARELMVNVMSEALKLGGHEGTEPVVAGRVWNDEPGFKPRPIG